MLCCYLDRTREPREEMESDVTHRSADWRAPCSPQSTTSASGANIYSLGADRKERKAATWIKNSAETLEAG